MLIQKKSDVVPSEITPKEVFDNRREFIQKAGFGLLAGAAVLSPALQAATLSSGTTEGAGRLVGRANTPPPLTIRSHQKISGYSKTAYGAGEKLTPYDNITTYNNYYEFGTDKSEPAIQSKLFKPTP